MLVVETCFSFLHTYRALIWLCPTPKKAIRRFCLFRTFSGFVSVFIRACRIAKCIAGIDGGRGEKRGSGANWHLPVIRIIFRERLLHFGFGNDADGTCHATRLRAALLVTKILHDDHEGDGQTLLFHTSYKFHLQLPKLLVVVVALWSVVAVAGIRNAQICAKSKPKSIGVWRLHSRCK